MSALYLVGFVQSVFFSLLIITKKKKLLKDYILVAFILMFGIQLFFIYSLNIGLYNKYPWLILSDFIYWTLLGPFLFKYVELSINYKKLFNLKDLLHLLPFFCVFVTHADYLINHIYSTDLVTYSNNHSENIFFMIGKFVFTFTNLFYYILTIILIHKHNKNIPDFFSNTKGVDLKLLNYLTHGFAIFIVLELVIILYGYKFDFYILKKIYSFSWIILNLYIFGIGYFGYKQQSIFSEPHQDYYPLIFKKEIIEGRHEYEFYKRPSVRKYLKSGLDNDEKKLLLMQLNNYMNTQKPYLDPELNLKTLSDQLKTSPHKLSQIINESLNKNFFDFINEYRVEEMKKILLDPNYQKYSITPLAYECGFNSISAFYNIFKKQTSKTPAEYRKTYIKSMDN